MLGESRSIVPVLDLRVILMLRSLSSAMIPPTIDALRLLAEDCNLSN